MPTAFALKAMDGSLVSYTNLSIPRDYFREYECTRPAVIGIRMDHFRKLVKLGKGRDNETVTIRYDDTHSSDLHIRMEAPGRTVNLRMYTFEFPADTVEIPTRDYFNKIVLPTNDLADMLANLARSSDHVIVSWKEECVQFGYNGDSARGCISLSNDHDRGIEIRTTAEFQSKFSLSFLKFIGLARGVSSTVELYANAFSPIKVHLPAMEQGSFTFYLAPLSEDAD